MAAGPALTVAVMRRNRNSSGRTTATLGNDRKAGGVEDLDDRLKRCERQIELLWDTVADVANRLTSNLEECDSDGQVGRVHRRKRPAPH
jgi:hypothetical protein